MTLAVSVPWWALLLLVAAAVLIAYGAYARPVVPLTLGQQTLLIGLRLLALLVALMFLLQPVATEPARTRDTIVPILIDQSRSMRLADQGETRRIDRAAELVRDEIMPALADDFQVDVLVFGDALSPADLDELQPVANGSDLVGALEALRGRYRGQPVAGVVVVSDGGDTSGRDGTSVVRDRTMPVFAFGVGALHPSSDREVVSVTAGEASVVDSVVDVSASVVSYGFDQTPIEVRLLEDGRLLQVRRLIPPAEGSPVRTVFRVSPKPDVATVYTVEIPNDTAELVAENNRRSVLVRPSGRPRRVLMIEGAPGYEHSFLKRAWLADAGISLDAVVRKGQNDRGEHTFYVQGTPDRTALLATGYPIDRAALFRYDALVLANIEAEFFRPDQLAMMAEFVERRGGGLLLLGSLTLTSRGFAGSPVEDVIPVELVDRGRADTAVPADAAAGTLVLTDDGASHPVMQLGLTVPDTQARWAAVPLLGDSVALGSPKPGATVLARVSAAGVSQSLIAVQRYGAGRSMIFAGESSWRWKMQLPAAERMYDKFWGQVVRWLAASAPEPIRVVASGGMFPGGRVKIDVLLRDAGYQPVVDGDPIVRVTTPTGDVRELQPALTDAMMGRYAAELGVDVPGVYRVEASATLDGDTHTAPDEWIMVGRADVELADPRLNEEVLRRIATASGGRLLDTAGVMDLPPLLVAGGRGAALPITRDLWHGVWTFLLMLVVLSTEWSLRRAWGMR